MRLFCKILILVQLVAISACSQQTDGNQAPGNQNITIHNYQQCVKFGGRMLKTYPPKCRTNSGEIFTQAVEAENCTNLCGDGLCASLVCEEVGCPCAENKDSCPSDCKH